MRIATNRMPHQIPTRVPTAAGVSLIARVRRALHGRAEPIGKERCAAEVALRVLTRGSSTFAPRGDGRRPTPFNGRVTRGPNGHGMVCAVRDRRAAGSLRAVGAPGYEERSRSYRRSERRATGQIDGERSRTVCRINRAVRRRRTAGYVRSQLRSGTPGLRTTGRSAEPNASVLVEHPARMVGNLPRVAVGIDEDT